MKYVWVLIFVVIIGGVVLWSRGGEVPKELPADEQKTQEITEPITSNQTVKNGMTIEIIKEGSGIAITNGQTAVVDYTGMLTNGTVFDSSIPRGQTFKFPLGAGMVIKGWDQGVLGMKVGETRKLTIPPELAYGERGAGALIPPNATLIFEVTLKGIE